MSTDIPAAEGAAAEGATAASTAYSSPTAPTPPPGGMRTFVQVLINAPVANLTTNLLRFADGVWV